MSDDCVFCKIVAGEIPSSEILSTDTTYAFADLSPQAPTHALVIPKRHIRDADDPQAAAVMSNLFAAARQVAVNDGLSPSSGGSGYRLVFNVGDDANNMVPHLHLHVIGGRKMTWPPG